MVNFKSLFLCILFLLFPAACDHLPNIISEIDQIEEKCEIITDKKVYKKYRIDPKKEFLLYYKLALSPEKRDYVSACGTHMSKNMGRHIESKAINNIPVGRVSYSAIDKNKNTIEYYLLCMVGGLSSTGTEQHLA